MTLKDAHEQHPQDALSEYEARLQAEYSQFLAHIKAQYEEFRVRLIAQTTPIEFAIHPADCPCRHRKDSDNGVRAVSSQERIDHVFTEWAAVLKRLAQTPNPPICLPEHYRFAPVIHPSLHTDSPGIQPVSKCLLARHLRPSQPALIAKRHRSRPQK